MNIKQRLKKRTFDKYNHYTEFNWKIKKFMFKFRKGLEVLNHSVGTHWQPIVRQTWG